MKMNLRLKKKKLTKKAPLSKLISCTQIGFVVHIKTNSSLFATECGSLLGSAGLGSICSWQSRWATEF